jgi:type IV pilus assembly protein PilA
VSCSLIEILVVIGLIAILAAIVIIAINPARQFAQGRDTQRTGNLNAILNAVGQRLADNKGKFDGLGQDGKTCPAIPNGAKLIDNAAGGTGLDLSCLVPTYISALPKDPSGPADPNTGYSIYQDGSGRIQEPNIPRTTDMETIR